MEREEKFSHVPVMAQEVLEYLDIQKDGVYFDGTLGGGGHTKLIAEKLSDKGKLVAVDLDSEAIKATEKNLSPLLDRVIFVKGNFRDIDIILAENGITKIDGAILDLGVSSLQLDKPERGFTFKEDIEVSLDMRMNIEQEFTAADVLNQYSKELLAKIFYEYGEEPFGRRIAQKVVETRKKKPIKTNKDLIEVLRQAIPGKVIRKRKRHFATNAFRALRMEVNHELSSLQYFLPKAMELLNKKGRMVIISFHSLEDRIVKNFFRDKARVGQLTLLTKKPITATIEEITKNPRARSAKLRAIELT